jgi:hypothetical protein
MEGEAMTQDVSEEAVDISPERLATIGVILANIDPGNIDNYAKLHVAAVDLFAALQAAEARNATARDDAVLRAIEVTVERAAYELEKGWDIHPARVVRAIDKSAILKEISHE